MSQIQERTLPPMDLKESLKNELHLILPSQPLNLLSEFTGIIRTGAVIKKHKNELYLLFTSRQPALIKKCVTQKKVLFPDSHHTIIVQEKNGIQRGIFYSLEFSATPELLANFGFQDENILKRHLTSNSAPHFLRGVFEARGYLGNPLRGYHLEIQLNSEKIATLILDFLLDLHWRFRSRAVKGTINLYSKHSQTIADFIQYLGAHQSFLELEKIMVEKSTINELTRWVNYETSNLDKIVKSSSRQRKKINALNQEILPIHLQEIAQLRLKNPCSSLREIGNLCIPPRSKSEVHRRLKKIEKIADQKRVYTEPNMS